MCASASPRRNRQNRKYAAMAVPQGGRAALTHVNAVFIGAGKMGPLCQRRLLVSAASAVVVGQQRVAVRPRHKRQGTGMAEKIINGFSVVAYATQPEGRVPARAFLETRRLPVKPPKDAVKPSRTPRRRRRKRRRSRKAKSRRIRRPSRKSRSLSRSSSAGAFAARSRRCRPRATRWTASRAWTRKACPTTCRSRPRAAALPPAAFRWRRAPPVTYCYPDFVFVLALGADG